MPTEPRIPVAPPNRPVGWGWRHMASRARLLGWDDYAARCDAMAAASERAGRDLREGEGVRREAMVQLDLFG